MSEKKPRSWAEWKASIRSRWVYPFARAEWASEWSYYRLRSLAIFDLLELAGRCTILIIAVLWVLEADDRAKQRHYRAWELINAAQGSTADAGRRNALQDLNEDGVSLAAAPLEQAYLPCVKLQNAHLWNARLKRADLGDADLQGANLWEAKLQCADLERANLKNVKLNYANLTRISRMRCRTGDAGQRIVYGDQYVIASSVASACLIQRVNR